MIRQLNSIQAFTITTPTDTYRVTLERIRNTAYGNPRFQATIDDGSFKLHNTVYRYTFTGHYLDETSEAEWIVKQHEERRSR